MISNDSQGRRGVTSLVQNHLQLYFSLVYSLVASSSTVQYWLTTLLRCFDGQLFGDVLSWRVTKRSAALFTPAAVVQMKRQCGDGWLWHSFLLMNVTILVFWGASGHVRYRHTWVWIKGLHSPGKSGTYSVVSKQMHIGFFTLSFFILLSYFLFCNDYSLRRGFIFYCTWQSFLPTKRLPQLLTAG